MKKLFLIALACIALSACRRASTTSDVTTFPGANAGEKITACLASINKGGICDATGFGASTQYIGSTVNVGVYPAAYGPTQLLLNPATKFQPLSSSMVMFLLGPYGNLQGLWVDTTNQPNYNGIVVLMKGYLTLGIGTVAAPHLTHCMIVGGNAASGVGLEVTTPDNGTASTYFSTTADCSIAGYYNDILLWTPSSSQGGINGNSFAHLQLGRSVYTIELRGESGYSRPALQLSANTFVDVASQAVPNLTKAGIYVHGGAAGNNFVAMQMFDAGGPTVLTQTVGSSDAGSGVYSNHFSGWISPIQDNAASTNNTVANIWDCFNCLGNESRNHTVVAKYIKTISKDYGGVGTDPSSYGRPASRP